LLVVPISALIRPIAFNTNFNQDIWILIGGTVFIIAALALGKAKKITRWHGLLLLSFYLIYTGYLVSKEL
jgi:cation:H+ antiporter